MQRSWSGSHVCQRLRGPTAQGLVGGNLSRGEKCEVKATPSRKRQGSVQGLPDPVWLQSLCRMASSLRRPSITGNTQNSCFRTVSRESRWRAQLRRELCSIPRHPRLVRFHPNGCLWRWLRAGVPGAGTTEPPPCQLLLLGTQPENRVDGDLKTETYSPFSRLLPRFCFFLDSLQSGSFCHPLPPSRLSPPPCPCTSGPF